MTDKVIDTANPAQPILEQDSTTTKAEKIERHGAINEGGEIVDPLSSRKRIKPEDEGDSASGTATKRQKGVASIKAESATSTHHTKVPN